MVARTDLKRQPLMMNLSTNWRQQLRDSSITPEKLLSRLELPAHLLSGMDIADKLFPLRVPEAYLQRIHPGDINDPLLRQILPVVDESFKVEGYSSDPVGDLASKAAPGVLHKYQNRALLLLTGACAVNCRYCFRRDFPYAEQQIKPAQWLLSLDYLSQTPSITEVIFSGGDPLILSTQKLTAITNDLQTISHLRRLRIHTRLPVMIPARITDTFCHWLASLPWPVSMVLHINHHRELSEDVVQACVRMRAAGICLLNQSVLLKGVNDEIKLQQVLSEKLYDAGILPYYLHQLDPVTGAQHFKVSDHEALRLHANMQSRLPGYLLPRLVREVPGEAAKLPLKEVVEMHI